MNSEDSLPEMLPAPTPPGILASIGRETRAALAGPMERIGMNPAEWFRGLSVGSRPWRSD